MKQGILGRQRARAARTNIRRQGTEFAAHCDPQKVGSRGLRSTTYIYPPGSRGTGKPDKYRA